MAKIVLASGSPGGRSFCVGWASPTLPSGCRRWREYFPAGLTPEETVCYISREKSQAVASDADEIVITADTMVFLDDKSWASPPMRRRPCKC